MRKISCEGALELAWFQPKEFSRYIYQRMDPLCNEFVPFRERHRRAVRRRRFNYPRMELKHAEVLRAVETGLTSGVKQCNVPTCEHTPEVERMACWYHGLWRRDAELPEDFHVGCYWGCEQEVLEKSDFSGVRKIVRGVPHVVHDWSFTTASKGCGLAEDDFGPDRTLCNVPLATEWCHSTLALDGSSPECCESPKAMRFYRRSVDNVPARFQGSKLAPEDLRVDTSVGTVQRRTTDSPGSGYRSAKNTLRRGINVVLRRRSA